MKKIGLAWLFATVSVFAKVTVVVSILPQETFVKKIAGEHVDIVTMVLPGHEPHSYEPKPSQMKMLSRADLYFSIGVEFEKTWLDKFHSQNKKLIIVDSAKGIKKMKMASHHHHEEGGEYEEHGAHSGLDPHVWLSPSNVKIIAKNIYHALVKADPDHQAEYKKGYEVFLSEIDKTDKQIKDILKEAKPHSKFLVFHPAFGYFAKEYHLIQVPIQVEGKEPTPKGLVHIINESKEEKVKAIFVSPEFSDKSAKIIANELGIKVLKFSSLDPQWSQNLIAIAKAIAGK